MTSLPFLCTHHFIAPISLEAPRTGICKVLYLRNYPTASAQAIVVEKFTFVPPHVMTLPVVDHIAAELYSCWLFSGLLTPYFQQHGSLQSNWPSPKSMQLQ